MKIIEIIKKSIFKWNNIYKPIRISIGIICFIIIVIVTHKCQSEMYKREFKRFYSTEIKGKIAEIKMGKGVSFFKINKNDTFFRFVDISCLSSSGRYNFGNFASFGDSVFKAAYGDTVYLYKNNILYKYTFVHISQ